VAKKYQLEASTPLERHVAKWLRSQARGSYDGDMGAVMKDLAYGGVQSGMVSHLIYTRDATKFYSRHRAQIAALLYDLLSDMGLDGPPGLFGDKWDAHDPLALDDQNQVLLAWFAFEETARRLMEAAGWEG